jgi:N-acetylglucosamine-6-sulfatase
VLICRRIGRSNTNGRALRIALALLAVLLGSTGISACTSATQHGSRPNIVVLMTDDQTQEAMRVLPKVKQLLADEGTTFTHSFSSYPLCCPSRVTYLTGQYAHNHGVLFNHPPYGGFDKFRHQDTTFPVALQKAGYRTIHIGKYLNGYGLKDPTGIPPGWSDWHASVDPSTYRYFDYTLNNNGTLHKYGRSAQDYQTDVYTRMAEAAIKDAAHRSEPFFLNVAFLAPHAAVPETAGPAKLLPGTIPTPTPAPRYLHTFDREPFPRPPSFDEKDMSDKPKFLQRRPVFYPKVGERIADNYRRELETLQSVDDAVDGIVRTLRETKQLDNTVILFTSDNGFFHGEHRIQWGKFFVYEPSVRVPLVIRGPGMGRGLSNDTLVANIDLAPTILALAHATPLRRMDGRSLVPLLDGSAKSFDRPILLESGPGGGALNPVYHAIRTPRYVYVEYDTGDRELYDLQVDPYELDNRASDPAMAPVRTELAAKLAQLKSCAGRSCSPPG